MSDLAALLLLPFLAAVIFVGMHTWLGLQVLRRGVVFADLALAQLSALGATVAVAAGHAPGGPEGFGYALLFTGLGAVLLTLTRRVQAEVSQEAVIGIVYVVATAFTVMVVDRSPQGAEHVKRMLVGDILTVGAGDVLTLALLYGAVGLAHAAFRRRLLAAAGMRPGQLVQPRTLTLLGVVFTSPGTVAAQLPPASDARSTMTLPGRMASTIGWLTMTGARRPITSAVQITRSFFATVVAISSACFWRKASLISLA